jgi:hypothetical protein
MAEACTLISLFLFTMLMVLLYGLGFFGGVPMWYKNIRQKRANCEDLAFAKDSTKWDQTKGEPKKTLDKASWDLTMYVQGHDERFTDNLAIKSSECLNST